MKKILVIIFITILFANITKAQQFQTDENGLYLTTKGLYTADSANSEFKLVDSTIKFIWVVNPNKNKVKIFSKEGIQVNASELYEDSILTFPSVDLYSYTLENGYHITFNIAGEHTLITTSWLDSNYASFDYSRYPLINIRLKTNKWNESIDNFFLKNSDSLKADE